MLSTIVGILASTVFIIAWLCAVAALLMFEGVVNHIRSQRRDLWESLDRPGSLSLQGLGARGRLQVSLMREVPEWAAGDDVAEGWIRRYRRLGVPTLWLLVASLMLGVAAVKLA